MLPIEPEHFLSSE